MLVEVTRLMVMVTTAGIGGWGGAGILEVVPSVHLRRWSAVQNTEKQYLISYNIHNHIIVFLYVRQKVVKGTLCGSDLKALLSALSQASQSSYLEHTSSTTRSLKYFVCLFCDLCDDSLRFISYHRITYLSLLRRRSRAYLFPENLKIKIISDYSQLSGIS